MIVLQLLVHLATWVCLSAAQEQPAEVYIKTPSAPAEMQGEDVDMIITNKQLRASTGSKSRWSIATGLNYAGGTLNSPFASARPNIAGATGTTDFASAGGGVSVKYALTTRRALLAGLGVRWITPLDGAATPQGYTGTKFDASNPYLNYQYIYRWSGIQSVATLSSTFFTQSDLVNEGFLLSLGLSQNNIYEIGQTGVSVGVSAYVGAGFYDRDDLAARQNQSDYSAGFDPYFEYQITDLVNFHTGLNLWTFEHIRSEARGDTFRVDAVTANLGLGFSLGRDVFLYPNIGFMPNRIQADRTVVAISSNINLF